MAKPPKPTHYSVGEHREDDVTIKKIGNMGDDLIEIINQIENSSPDSPHDVPVKNSFIQVRVPEDLKESFMYLCERLNVPQSTIIRAFMYHFIKHHEIFGHYLSGRKRAEAAKLKEKSRRAKNYARKLRREEVKFGD